MKLTKNFTFEELTRTSRDSLQTKNIEAADAYIDNLSLLAANLQQLRDALDRPITISSGFRCVALNQAVGGKVRSSHTQGLAADISVDGMSADDLFAFIRSNHPANLAKCIIEKVRGREWVHFAVSDEGKEPVYFVTTDGENYERV